MCGISGIAVWKPGAIASATATAAINRLFRLSERRGKEAAGIAIRSTAAVSVFKRPMAAHRMIRTRAYRDFIGDCLAEAAAGATTLAAPFATVSHARLVTNGQYGVGANNQPVVAGGAVAVHNGIIVNDAALWREHPELHRRAEVDTEIIPALLAQFSAEGTDVAAATSRLYECLVGEANIAMLFAGRPMLLLATNTGSLYWAGNAERGTLAFASELPILRDFLKHGDGAAFAGAEISHLIPGMALRVDLSGGGPAAFRFSDPAVQTPPDPAPASVPLRDPAAAEAERRRNLRRCTRCILPETIPGISFDGDGVCSYCRAHRPFTLKGIDALQALADRYRRSDGRPDCVVSLSGGRDSSYGLHFIKRELGLNPIAYTYDWALVTDLARRNQSRMCAALGVEHVLVSADIQAKRRYIRKNVEAWLHRPDLGMVPLFMAGDKLYFYYAREVARRYDVEISIVCGNRFEMTDFKSGFAGVGTHIAADDYRPYGISRLRKLRLIAYYFGGFLRNPRYLNSSLIDTAIGFYSSYVMPHNFLRLYDFIPWEEDTINATLRETYQWEEATDTNNTWRIGDGTAAFYNYIYYTIAGFTEHDTFRANQIRAGVIGREEGLALLERDNRPRFASMRDYANTIGFDLDKALAAIDMAPRLY